MGGWRGTGLRTMTGAVLAAVLAVAGCTSGRSASPANTTGSAVAAPASSATGGFQPGAAGVGDPYYPTYGNGGYDVASYLLKLRYDPAANELNGQETITATATADLSRFDLDFAGLTVNSITVNGRPATNRRDQNELRVTPAAGLRSGSTFTVAVDYGGAPQPVSPSLGVGGFLHDKDGAIAVGQPESAAAWLPVNDHPSDKATYQIEITVPEGLSAISNGVLQGSTTAGGWTTWKWAEQAPMASYLATLAIGKYRVTTSQHDGKPVLTAVASALPVGSADQAMARTVEIADFLTTQFGPYPFDAYGGIVVADTRVGYALETQTRPVYGPSFFRGSNGTWVVAHELAHQWYGDSVALERWQDIWLNEGFATYAEWLWTEHTGGDSVQQSFRSVYASVSDEVWRTPPGDPGVANLFSTSVYKRGAMTLQALRLTVGDNAFFRIIKEWAAEKRNGNGTTAEFITLAEKLSGRSLRPMFNAWLYQKTKAALPTP
jgi:aminopeptidase N